MKNLSLLHIITHTRAVQTAGGFGWCGIDPEKLRRTDRRDICEFMDWRACGAMQKFPHITLMVFTFMQSQEERDVRGDMSGVQ
ncbi:hypothetical protein DPX16_1929 [Anabarilius grahami]|uniref:Uncharacterized protein n=1 Tax=Anabarilius grahami TaxID=495550 RepID=A0A3N0Z598_ANAGA|nr:hypothetical protein DPX16_1929 [Anabarilius grahami]